MKPILLSEIEAFNIKAEKQESDFLEGFAPIEKPHQRIFLFQIFLNYHIN